MTGQQIGAASRKVASLVLIVLISLPFISGFISGADVQVSNEPASEGRQITPAGTLVIDAATKRAAVGAMPVNFIHSPDHLGADGRGRYLVVVNSGFGVQFDAKTSRSQQSLAVIDLNAKPAPTVIQDVYFPSPQSVNVGVAFSPKAAADGSYTLYAAGGFENKIWMFQFRPENESPIYPASPGPDTKVTAPFIDVSGFTTADPTPRYNNNVAPVYPTGLAISPDGNSLYVANNLGDTMGIVSDIHAARKLSIVDLHRGNRAEFMNPFDVVILAKSDQSSVDKAYVSCWSADSIAVVKGTSVLKSINVGHHPTAMLLNAPQSRLFVVNSNADSVSVIDTASDQEIERINLKMSEAALNGSSPEGLSLTPDGTTLYVANAHSDAVAVVALSARAQGNDSSATPSGKGARSDREEREESATDERRSGPNKDKDDNDREEAKTDDTHSSLRGFIPTGQYPSAVGIAGGHLFVGNGKGTGFANSSMIVDNSGRAPNAPNEKFPVGRSRGGQYSVSLISGNISQIDIPSERALAAYTQQVMRNNGLIGREDVKLFRGKSPIKHVIYIIKENRTYDQVFGDLTKAGDGTPADGDAKLAIFGHSDAAKLPSGATQNISPNHQALVTRFGVFDRFFVNSEASPDGHNWATAAFSTDYVDKAYRWNYSRRGRTYDFEGFNRLPSYGPNRNSPPMFKTPVEADTVADFMRKYIPYLNGGTDAAEPTTLYLWDAAAKAGLSYRNYGEFVATISQGEVDGINKNKGKGYPDLSPTVSAIPTKKSLEGHYSKTYRNFDLNTPDSMTTDSYRVAKESGGKIDPLITSSSPTQTFRGTSRVGDWLDEFHQYVSDLQAGQDHLPNLSIVRISNDHTSGMSGGMATPQFYVADNDYGVGRLVEAVSSSSYWRDTAIFVVEDDAQDGPDHVDAHRSVAMVISAYNKPGSLIHQFHNTVSLIRTMELLLGIEPMNLLDATAAPMAIFQEKADLTPYKAILPDVALDNLINKATPGRDNEVAYWMRLNSQQDFTHEDMADPKTLNDIIWFSVKRGTAPSPEIARLPAFDLMKIGLEQEREEAQARSKNTIARR